MNNSFTDEDIILFLNSYNDNLLNGVVLDRQIPNYAVYLKSIKYYRDNGIEADPFFKKRLNISKDDDEKIMRLIDRLKRGKNLYHRQINNSTRPVVSNTTATIYSQFNENEEYVPKFELMNSLQGAMNDYNRKMEKRKIKTEKNKHSNTRSWDTTEQDQDRYYRSEGKQLPQQRFVQEKPINVQHSFKQWDDPYERKVPTTFNYRKHSEFTDSQKSTDPIADRAWLNSQLINAPETRNNFIKNEHVFGGNQYFDERLTGTSSRLENRMPFKR
jgi:hypothetical protein